MSRSEEKLKRVKHFCKSIKNKKINTDILQLEMLQTGQKQIAEIILNLIKDK